MRKGGRTTVLLLSLFLAGCGGDVVEVPEPRLRSISVDETELVLPAEGTAELHFSVRDPEAVFEALELVRSDGEPPVEYSLLRVLSGDGPGRYTAVIRDHGTEPLYRESAQLRIVLGAGTGRVSYIASPSFTVESEAAASGGIVLKTGLPVVRISTEGGAEIRSKEDYLPARLSIDGKGTAPDLQELGCEIRGRGNTTWTWPKKPYLVRLESRTEVLGMPSHRRWVLLANFMDRTLMRNLLASHVAALTALDWTPSCIPVELVLNGRHEGSYLLTEQIRVDRNRLDLPEDGFLLELDFHFDNPVQWISPYGRSGMVPGGIPFSVKHPEPENLSPERLSQIKDKVEKAAAALYGPDFKDPEKGYAAFLDVGSFIDYWIVFEVMGNHELGNPGSIFMHGSPSGKIVAGPCWDFDWGALSYRTSPQAQYGLINRHAIWYDRLFEDPAFCSKLRARYEELLPALSGVPAFIDSTERLLTASARLNFALWDPSEDASQNGGQIINGDEYLSFHEAVVRLKDIYSERLEIIRKNLP